MPVSSILETESLGCNYRKKKSRNCILFDWIWVQFWFEFQKYRFFFVKQTIFKVVISFEKKKKEKMFTFYRNSIVSILKKLKSSWKQRQRSRNLLENTIRMKEKKQKKVEFERYFKNDKCTVFCRICVSLFLSASDSMCVWLSFSVY